jgi:ATP-dependent Clp protease, protease subunit
MVKPSPDQIRQLPPTASPGIAYYGFTGPIESNSVTRICSALNYAVNNGHSGVCLAFSSLGGYTADGIFLYNYLRAMPIPVTIHAIGNIASIAVASYLGAEKRVCSKHVLLMMHPTVVPSSAEGATWERAQGAMFSALAEEKRVENILRERAGIPELTLNDRTVKDVHITAEKALEFGIAHELGEFAIPKGARIAQI